ncbi:MAG: hypothetical protein AAGG69_00280 [Pseudomonadota bacterium]
MAKEKEPSELARADLAQEEMGNNQLQGDDQANVHNERREVAGVKLETDGIVESFKKLEKDKRAKEELGKGNMRDHALKGEENA